MISTSSDHQYQKIQRFICAGSCGGFCVKCCHRCRNVCRYCVCCTCCCRCEYGQEDVFVNDDHEEVIPSTFNSDHNDDYNYTQPQADAHIGSLSQMSWDNKMYIDL